MTLTTRIIEHRSRPMQNGLTYGENWEIAYNATKCRFCAQELANAMGNEKGNAVMQRILDQHDNGQHGKGK